MLPFTQEGHVRNLKILILLCGGALLGLMISNGLDFTENRADTLIMLTAYALPTVMGLMGIVKPPMQAWQAAIALAGFGVAAVRTKIWETLPHVMDATNKDKVSIGLLVVGVLVSVIAMIKPEDKS